jgi:xylitol oxidase
VPLRNWSGTYEYRARRLHRPTTLAEAREIAATAPRLRVLGSRHSFTAIGDSDALLSLEALPGEAVVDHAAGTVSVPGGMRYGELAAVLDAEGVALQNLASLPHISVVGAVATASHGSGDRHGNLATAVAGLELVTSRGEVVTAARGEPGFPGMVVGLGALGAVTRVVLDVEPAYEVRQRVFEGLRWEALLEHFDAILAAGDSVSVFSRWGEEVEQVWVKSRVGDAPEVVRDELFGARPAAVERHPILGLDPESCSPQLGVPGPWWDRWPHFRLGFTPSHGQEIQSEYHVPRGRALEAIGAVRAIGPRVQPVLQVSEIRTVAADELWLSPQHGQDTASFHFTWKPDPVAVDRALVHVEAALMPLGARPHWGKAFRATAAEIAPRYPRLPDFRRLAARLDPRAAFANDWLEERVLRIVAPRHAEQTRSATTPA